MQFSELHLQNINIRSWKLLRDFRLHGSQINPMWTEIGLEMDDEGAIVVREGFSTDLGTTPRMFWCLCSPTDIAFAAVIHDKMYQLIDTSSTLDFKSKRLLRKEADDLFFDALAAQPGWTPHWRIWMCWAAVRIGGWSYVNKPWK